MLINSGFPQAKEFFRRLSTVCARALKRSPASSRPKNFKEYQFEGAQNERPTRSAHMSRTGPNTLNIETKPLCDATSFFIPRENQI